MMKVGFARLSLEERRAISRKGGSSVPPHRRFLYRNQDAAVQFGRKGGIISGRSKRNRKKMNEVVE